jgi:hypothetical protein
MLIKRQTEPDRRKPELKVFSFYSKVAEELGLSISDVDAVYSDFINQVMEIMPNANKISIPNMGEFKVNSRKMRVTFFKRIIYMCDLLLDPEYPKRKERAETALRIIETTLEKMVKNFESCVICNLKEHTIYMCVRNAVGNIYFNIDRIAHLEDEVAQNAISCLKEMYDKFAPRIIVKAEELEATEFAENYKQYIISQRPELEETWGNGNVTKQKLLGKYLSIEELEKIYIPEYDINYYL